MDRRLIFRLYLVLISLAGFAQSEKTRIRILHVNDFHGFAAPHQPVGAKEKLGGIAFLAARADSLRQEVPSLLLAAGDMWQGSNWVNFFQGASGVAVMNQIGFDAMVLGNHEFDAGQEVLHARISEASFPVLCANIQGFEGIHPYVRKDIAGVRLGIIGVTTEDAPLSTSPKNVIGLQFLPIRETVQRAVDELRAETDVVVVLSHAGHGRERALAEEVEGIDLIVGGHSHTKVERPAKIGGTWVVQAWEHAKALGVVDLTVEGGHIASCEGHLEEIKPVPGAEDPAIDAMVQSYQSKVDAVLSEVIGRTKVDLDGSSARAEETNLGDFIADLMREVSHADATIINAGGLRASILQGEIQVKDVYSVLPFDNYVVAIRLTGQQVWDTLEHGVSAVEDLEGRFPQVSGLTFTYDAEARKGKRILEVFIQGEPIDPERSYTVATNDFLAAGGDGYRDFGNAIKSSPDFAVVGGAMTGERVVYSDASRWLRDIVADAIRQAGTIAPAAEGRIKESEGPFEEVKE